MGANPVAWLIPCHRVLRSEGELRGGYRWGTTRKAAGLLWEEGKGSGRVSVIVSVTPRGGGFLLALPTTNPRLKSPPMQRPTYKRQHPKIPCVMPVPAEVDLKEVAQCVRYIGSQQHKDCPSMAGPAPRPYPSASICPSNLAHEAAKIQGWLATAILKGHTGPWDRGFPKYVWHQVGEVLFEARLTNAEQGHYKGYPLEPGTRISSLEESA